jgi:Domain of unknown function DUF29
MHTRYESDIVAWANEQARLIRSGQLNDIDWAHIAEEIEDVGKSEQRELASRMAVLLAHLLKWQGQPDKRTRSWDITIRAQRAEVAYHLKDTPSLRTRLTDVDWVDMVWRRAVGLAATETGLVDFPDQCPWTMADTLTEAWLPPAT